MTKVFKTYKPNAVKKFYFLEYFYIALKSVKSKNNDIERLRYFKTIKNKFQLGESKYKKLKFEKEEQEKTGVFARYKYTFNQVIHECKLYNLIKEENGKLYLTRSGEKCVDLFESESGDKIKYKLFLLDLMESLFNAFHQLLTLCYKNKNGLLFFPIYSPLKLGFEKSKLLRHIDILRYIEQLVKQIEEDISEVLGKKISLVDTQVEITKKLLAENYISDQIYDYYEKTDYNIIIKRIRDFYLSKILNIYNYPYSYDTFNIWTERAKKFGILHATDFYPGLNGRIVFPTAILSSDNSPKDFNEVFKYFDNEKLLIHSPKWDIIEEEFVGSLVDAYFSIKKARRTHFISLLDVKEKVCYRLRISAQDFDKYIAKTYEYSILGKLKKVQLSLEADKLPEETTAMYLKREPIIVSGKQKNIIAINFK